MFVGAVRGAGVCDVRGLCCWGRGQLVVISREKRGKTRNQRETIFCPEHSYNLENQELLEILYKKYELPVSR